MSDKEEKDLMKAAALADNYSLIHKVHSKGAGFVKHSKVGRDSWEGRGEEQTGSKGPFCKYCRKEGHNIFECKEPSYKRLSCIAVKKKGL